MPANEPADPAAVEVTSLKLPTAPTDGAEVGTASACVYDCENENAAPGLSCVAAIAPGE